MIKSGTIIVLVIASGLVALNTLQTGLHSSSLDAEAYVAPDSDVAEEVSLFEETPIDPARLIIPALKINAKVQQVGITTKGTMSVPTNYKDVGWYKYGPMPGEAGTAVIAGHLDNGFGFAAVFKKLAKLEEGDEVTIVGKDGTELTYEVEKMESVVSTLEDTTKIFSKKGESRIALVTCEGTWNKKTKTYSHRTIVYARLVSE